MAALRGRLCRAVVLAWLKSGQMANGEAPPPATTSSFLSDLISQALHQRVTISLVLNQLRNDVADMSAARLAGGL